MVARLYLRNSTKFYIMRQQEETIYYTYVNNGKEFFTSNEDLAHKRADEGTEIKVYKQD